ncbi:2Fe-2S iron-sulfur cluster-binding protein [Stenotrophomonas mori]|uniref:2Fe-2S iron-sulfur cluster binding domain-containing protein n=1 Tax=Stenotrophomonas mori TaxID=2871096 RepID=A0ABT0SGA9_9GAMM|nr:2Fe-2S iron-sulfur cluster-binding protein [Stenotrophomonas mori]MCL7714348.1 2Fe-2S iron-sulfur cluster binding domain-containing protein [Stenotrophomonas mori]
MGHPAIIHYQGRRYDAAHGEAILDALLRQGAPMAHSCGKGSCHTCVLKLEAGRVHHARALDATLQASGHLLPCVAHAEGEVRLAPADMARVATPAELMSRRHLGGGVFEIGIAPLTELSYRGGQHLQLVRSDGLARSYSLASLPEDDFLFHLHVRHTGKGGLSHWLCELAPIGERLDLFAPQGDCHYHPGMAARRLLLLATGAGAGALLAVARDALAAGHRQPIHLYHGVRDADGLYLHDTLRDLERRHPNVRYTACISGAGHQAGREDARRGHVTQAFAEADGLADTSLFLCGRPAMVEDARCLAVAGGVPRAHIHADPFDPAGPARPRDAEKIAAIPPDPELWAALACGPGLRHALERFYDRVYEDERLSPFFTRVPKERIVSKQYSFLSDLFSGKRDFFGLKPYNAHHWMVISDELFDHHETLLAAALRDHGLAEHLIHRIGGLLERFRAEIVKPVARGMVIDGRQLPLQVDEVETLDLDGVCDGCGGEIPAGRPVRYQHRLGTLHCAGCAGLPAVTG